MATPDAANPSASIDNAKKIEQQLKEEAERFINLAKNLKDATLEIVGGAESINKSFLNARVRIYEFVDAISDATPKMAGLGAEAKDVYDTIASIASGTRRQLVASTKDLMSVFAASEVSGEKVDVLVDKFAQVGYNYTVIGEEILGSVNLLTSLGANAKVVLGDVLKNTEQLSRFNFENGVQGLTRMAAQASMLRFDMNQTFQLAEKVLDPDQAVSVASAFQRLGVAAGNLVDPLSLLNQSLTDPSGLQDSLINVARQFSYFDEQSQSFKINPQGILTLKEIETQTGVSAKTMREAALAAAEMDRRLAALSQLNISKEFSQDDKNLLANISRFKDGKLEVRVSKAGEVERYEELQNLNQKQAEALVEEQKKAPKTIEDLQRAQLNTGEKSLSELRRLNATLAQSIIGIPGYSGELLKTTDQVRDSFTGLSDLLLGKTFQGRFEDRYRAINEARTEEEKKVEIEKLKNDIYAFLPVMTKNLGEELGSFVSGTFGKEFFTEYLGEFTEVIKIPLGKGQQTPKISTGLDLDNSGTDRRTRAVYGAGPTASNNTINLAELMSRVNSQSKPPITVYQTNTYTQTNTEVSPTFAKDFFQNLGRQDIEKLKKMLEDVQNATGQ